MKFENCSDSNYPSDINKCLVRIPDGGDFKYYIYANCPYGWNVLISVNAQYCDLNSARVADNNKIIRKLAELIQKYPDMTFGQIIVNFIMDDTADAINKLYEEESVVTLNRLKEKANEYSSDSSR